MFIVIIKLKLIRTIKRQTSEPPEANRWSKWMLNMDNVGRHVITCKSRREEQEEIIIKIIIPNVP